MTANISFNPVQTTNAVGTFGVDWGGGMQGTAMPDPASRYWLAGGYVGASESTPMWGGLGVCETVPTPGSATLPNMAYGPEITRATQIAQGSGNLSGFTVFDQNYSAINTPQSRVPVSSSLQSVHFYRFGTNARVWLPINPALQSVLYGVPYTEPVSWDFVGQQLIPYQAAYASASVESATYTSATGVLAVTFASAPATSAPTVGTTFSISGMTTSAGSASAVNGDFQLVSSGSSGTVLNFNVGSGLGTITINSSTGTLAAGGGGVPIRGILRAEVGNSMVVSYNAASNYANWLYNGSTALVQL